MWRRLRGLIAKRRPPRLTLQWQITERCNQRCVHCYQEDPPADEAPSARWPGVVAQFKELLDSIEKGAWGQVTISGGEPLSHPDAFALLEALAAEKPRLSFALLTNGSLIDGAVARRLRSLGPRYVQVSVEGAEATHDRMRGAGSHRRTVEAIEWLVGAGVSTLISFTAHRENFREFPEVAELGGRLGVERVWADRLIPLGRGAALGSLTGEEARKFFGLMRAARRRTPQVAMHRALQFLECGGRPYRCTAGRTLIALQPNGDVYPCRRLPLRAGNAFATSLGEVYHGSALLGGLREATAPAECAQCPHAEVCRGGLRCLAHAATGDAARADPGCWLILSPSCSS
jgi:radical SAM protein with 4Fe4S-binding SPASM domain